MADKYEGSGQQLGRRMAIGIVCKEGDLNVN
jgi:hypothetical protein